MFKKTESANCCTVFVVMVSFYAGYPFLYGACEHYVVVVIKMVSKFMDAYFLWVPIYMYVCMYVCMYVYIIDCMCINE